MKIEETLLETFMKHATKMQIDLYCGCVFVYELARECKHCKHCNVSTAEMVCPNCHRQTTSLSGLHIYDCAICDYHVQKTDGNNFDGPGEPAPPGEWAHMVRCDLNEHWRAQ